MGIVHPRRPDELPHTNKDMWDKASERWWADEEAFIRPTSRWAILVAAALGLLFWWGVLKLIFG